MNVHEYLNLMKYVKTRQVGDNINIIYNNNILYL